MAEPSEGAGDEFEAAFRDRWLAEYPEAMDPVIGWLGIDANSSLWEGSVAVEFDGTWHEGAGSAAIRWWPRPRVVLQVDFPDVDFATGFRWVHGRGATDHIRFRVDRVVGEGVPAQSDFSQSLPDGGLRIRVDVYSFTQPGPDASELRFDVVNLEWIYGSAITDGRGVSNSRLLLNGGGWEVTLDGRAPGVEPIKQREPDGRYVITHTGRAVKSDGSSISPVEARRFITMLQYALSIPQSRWVTPICVEGRAGDGSGIWRIWDLWVTGRWAIPLNWIPALYTHECQQEFFERLSKRWYESPESEQLLRTATHYYLDAHGEGLLHRGLIMGTSLIELVAWDVLDAAGALPKADAFDQDFAWKVRKLLTLHGVPIVIPRSLPALQRLAREKGWGDAPKALSEIRHTAVHAKRHPDGWEWGSDVWLETGHLCDWYTDLAILIVVGYEGRYLNRITATNQAEWEWVPWTTVASEAST